MPFATTIRVRYAEVDQQNVVFNAHWMAYFDITFSEYLEELGHGPQALVAGETSFDTMLVHAELDWQGSAGYRDDVVVEVSPVRLGKSSFDMAYRARVGDEVKVTGTLTYVSVDASFRPTPIPDPVRGLLQKAVDAEAGAAAP